MRNRYWQPWGKIEVICLHNNIAEMYFIMDSAKLRFSFSRMVQIFTYFPTESKQKWQKQMSVVYYVYDVVLCGVYKLVIPVTFRANFHHLILPLVVDIISKIKNILTSSGTMTERLLC